MFNNTITLTIMYQDWFIKRHQQWSTYTWQPTWAIPDAVWLPFINPLP